MKGCLLPDRGPHRLAHAESLLRAICFDLGALLPLGLKQLLGGISRLARRCQFFAQADVVAGDVEMLSQNRVDVVGHRGRIRDVVGSVRCHGFLTPCEMLIVSGGHGRGRVELRRRNFVHPIHCWQVARLPLPGVSQLSFGRLGLRVDRQDGGFLPIQPVAQSLGTGLRDGDAALGGRGPEGDDVGQWRPELDYVRGSFGFGGLRFLGHVRDYT